MDPQNTPVAPTSAPTPMNTGVPPKMPEMKPDQKGGSIGPIIGIVIIIAVLALGGIYYWVTQMQKLGVSTEEIVTPTTTTTTTTTANDDPNAIEDDLNQTNINVDANLEGTVNSEFGGQ